MSEPRPLRSNAYPNGIPGIAWLDKLKVSQANKLYHLTSQIVKFCLEKNLLVCVENPQYSLFWATTFWVSVASQMQYTIHHACQYGSKRAKKTMLAHNHKAFHQICLKCPGVSSKHRHESWGVHNGKFATSAETAYPFPLAKSIAHAFTVALYENGAIPPPSTLSEITSSSTQVLQAARSQTGLQPKASKIPPIVSDFKTQVVLVAPQELLPKYNLSDRLNEPVAVNPEVASPYKCLPKHARLISIQTGVDQMKGGDQISTPEQSSKQIGSNNAVSQKWAIPWEPLEFIAAAHKAGHPMSLRSVVPEVLQEVVRYYDRNNIADRVAKRAENAKYWLAKASSLAAEEKQLKSKLHPSVCKVLSPKRIVLWREMLKAYNYHDLGVVDELVNGTKLTGNIPPCGLWPAKFSPSTVTEEELSSIARRERPLVQHSAIISEDEEVNSSVWQQRLEEVQSGLAEGPFDLEVIPSSSPISRRFGIRQNGKIRCVDDFTGSSVNGSIQTHETPRPHTLDIVGGLLSLCMGCLDSKSGWQGRVFDLKSAYRQCAISPASIPFSYIGVFDPKDRKVKAFRLVALPFGSIAAVHAFLRIAASIWFLGLKVFNVLWTNYFDDFVTVCPQQESKSVTSSIHCLFSLLGWKFADSGSKAPPFADTFQALGVLVNLADLHRGLVRFDNTQTRKAELASAIKAILESKNLAHRDALKLRGRMQFSAGQLFGRISRTCLAVVTARAYSKVGKKLSPKAVSALSLYLAMLTCDEPRVLAKASNRTWMIFTDASFEPGQGTPEAGIGGVLVNPAGKPTHYFSCKLTSENISRLNPNRADTIIFELEFLAVLCAFRLWSCLFSGAQVISFVDNNGVRDALISCHSSNCVGASILKEILKLESTSKVLQWYSRVPSISNIADDPSRFVFTQLKALGCRETFLNLDCVVDELDLSK